MVKALLAAIERMRKAPLFLLVALGASAIVGLAGVTGAAEKLIALVRPAPPPDPRGELVRLGIPFTVAALSEAAKNGDLPATKLLLAAGMRADGDADPQVDGDGPTPALVAASRGHEAVLVALIGAGASWTWRNDAGWNVFDLAAMQGQSVAVRAVLARHPTQAQIDHAFQAAAWGADKGLATARLLAPILKDRVGQATKALAEMPERVDPVAMAKLLISMGADPRGRDADGVPVFFSAARRDDDKLVRLFVATGVPVDMRGTCAREDTPQPVTALTCAIRSGQPEGAAALITAGADVNAPGLYGRTPLHLAARRGMASTVRLLLSHGADATARDEEGLTPLDAARAEAEKRGQSGDPAAVIAVLERNGSAGSPATPSAARPRS